MAGIGRGYSRREMDDRDQEVGMPGSLWERLKRLGRTGDNEKCETGPRSDHRHRESDGEIYCPECGARIDAGLDPHDAYCPECHGALKPW